MLNHKNIGFTKKFVQVFLLHFTEKPKRTFWSTKYICVYIFSLVVAFKIIQVQNLGFQFFFF